MSTQQNQTKTFFKGHANEWQRKSENNIYSVINDRHRAVHRTLDQYPIGSTLLDVGCGTGQLAIEASSKGYEAIGIDFAEEMISLAKKNAVKNKSSASFEVGSIFDYQPSKKFDVISAMGFIEYISLDQLVKLLEFFYKNLSDGGAISIGSRNRLFNICTFNEYTELEGSLSVINDLILEASIAVSANSTGDFLSKLKMHIGNSSLVQNETHPFTGIGVKTRYQFTPSDLLYKVESAGFKAKNIYPVNYHSFNPIFSKGEILVLREDIAEIISKEHQTDIRLLPNSSSFVLEAKK